MRPMKRLVAVLQCLIIGFCTTAVTLPVAAFWNDHTVNLDRGIATREANHHSLTKTFPNVRTDTLGKPTAHLPIEKSLPAMPTCTCSCSIGSYTVLSSGVTYTVPCDLNGQKCDHEGNAPCDDCFSIEILNWSTCPIDHIEIDANPDHCWRICGATEQPIAPLWQLQTGVTGDCSFEHAYILSAPAGHTYDVPAYNSVTHMPGRFICRICSSGSQQYSVRVTFYDASNMSDCPPCYDSGTDFTQ